MGYDKDREIQQDEQGWRYSDKIICFRCLRDPYLRTTVKNQASKWECDFCGWRSRTPNSVPFNELMQIIAESVFQYYSHAEEDTIAWDSEEQTYVGSTYSTWDLVRHTLAPSDSDEVLKEIIESLGDHVWCDKAPYSLSESEHYEYSWETFCKTVKHEVRYFFNDSLCQAPQTSDAIPLPEMLDELQGLIDEAGLVQTLPAGTSFFRVRAHSPHEVCKTCQQLGSPPPEVAASNRMSAAGISVFYAALDMPTAKVETAANLLPNDPRALTGAKWSNSRPLRVLDLIHLPSPPSFYARVRFDREHILFLRQFVENITQPVAHDGKEHIEYVPTQILTEYFRHRYRTRDGARLDGIVYPSAQRKRGRSIVIFASQDDLNPAHAGFRSAEPPLLALDSASLTRLRRNHHHSPSYVPSNRTPRFERPQP